MAMKVSDTILGAPRGNPATYLAHLDGPDDDDRLYVNGVAKWAPIAGVDTALVYAWFDVETAAGTSVRWTRDNNPGGIAIPSDSTVQPFVIPDGEHAARIHVQCLYSMVTGRRYPDVPLWPGIEDWFLRVWLQKVHDPKFPDVARITDLDIRYTDSTGEPQASWAWGHQEGQPAEECVRRANAIFGPNLPTQGATPQPPEVPTVALTIRQGITPALNENRPGIIVNADGTTRPGKMLRASFTINWHETANTAASADAEMHRRFVWNGGGDQGVSFHFVVDDKEAVQLLPLDEQGIHIGTAEGNATCIGIETCVNKTGAGWAKAKENLVALTIAILKGDPRIDYGQRKASDFDVDQMTIHGDWTGTSCPARIRQEGARNTLVQAVRNGLGSPLPPPPPPTVPPPPPTANLPEGLDLDLAKKWHGKVTKAGKTFAFDPADPFSLAWLTLGAFPRITGVETYDTREYRRYAGGQVLWRANPNAPVKVLGE